MPAPVRTTPTCNVALVRLFVGAGSPEIEAPSGITPPWSRPFGPAPRAGEPGNKLNQSRMVWAWFHVVKKVWESCGIYLSSGGLVELPPPRPVQEKGMRLLVKVTMALVQLRTSFSAS